MYTNFTPYIQTEDIQMANAKNDTAKFGFMTNPAIKRLSKVISDEQASVTASYAGVTAKTVYFLVWTVIGIAAFFILNNTLLQMTPETYSIIQSEEGIFEFPMTLASGGVIGVVALVTIVTALVSIFAMAALPVIGAIYSIAQGYLLAFITNALAPDYKWLGYLALMLTIIIVATLLFLYGSGKIKVGHRFRAAISTLCITLIISSLAVIVISFVPWFRPAADAISAVTANPIVSIVISAAFVLIACLFLVSDFDATTQIVNAGMPKKYEWICAFGIAYTVLYLYIKILELLVRIFGRSDPNR